MHDDAQALIMTVHQFPLAGFADVVRLCIVIPSRNLGVEPMGQKNVRGDKEEGTTSTPFDMVVLNDLDRFHLVADVIDRVVDESHGEAEVLASCYRRSLQVAAELGVRSLAFPAISTGVYGYPKAEAAAVAVRTIRQAGPDSGVELVRLLAFDEATLLLYERLLA